MVHLSIWTGLKLCNNGNVTGMVQCRTRLINVQWRLMCTGNKKIKRLIIMEINNIPIPSLYVPLSLLLCTTGHIGLMLDADQYWSLKIRLPRLIQNDWERSRKSYHHGSHSVLSSIKLHILVSLLWCITGHIGSMLDADQCWSLKLRLPKLIQND